MSGKMCLIVDDSKVVRMVAKKALTELGLDHKEVENGKQGIDACKSSMPDAIILDWNMPEMNGVEFLKELRGMAGGDKPYVILCTTEAEERAQEAMDAGANTRMKKPFDKAAVEAALGEAGFL